MELVALFDRIVQLDGSFEASRNSTLKRRFGEAVKDENLKREIRRLDWDCPELDFFSLRDRALDWLGKEPTQQNINVREVTLQETIESSLAETIRLHGEQLAEQQRQITPLSNNVTKRKGPPRCWSCGVIGHVRRNCASRSSGVDLNNSESPANARLEQPAMTCRMVGGISDVKRTFFKKAIGDCPEAVVKLGKSSVRNLL